MPHNLRPRTLQRILRDIEEWTIYGDIPPVRRYLEHLCGLYAEIEAERYLSRPKTYRAYPLHLDNGLRFQDRAATH